MFLALWWRNEFANVSCFLMKTWNCKCFLPSDGDLLEPQTFFAFDWNLLGLQMFSAFWWRPSKAVNVFCCFLVETCWTFKRFPSSDGNLLEMQTFPAFWWRPAGASTIFCHQMKTCWTCNVSWVLKDLLKLQTFSAHWWRNGVANALLPIISVLQRRKCATNNTHLI